MGAAVSSGGLRSVVAPSSSTSLVHSSARFSVALSGVSFRDMHGYAGGRKAHSGSVANSGMDGPEGGSAPAAATAVEGGDASLEKSEPAVERCDAHVELLTLIVGEDSTQKRKQLGSVLAWLLNKERAFASSLSKEYEVSQERAQPPLPDKGATQQPLHVEKESLNDGDAKEKFKAWMRDAMFDVNRPRSVSDPTWSPPQEVLDNLDAKEDTEEDKTEEYTEGYYNYTDDDTMEEEIEQDREEDTEETTHQPPTQQPLPVEKESWKYSSKREYAPSPIKSYSHSELKRVTSRYSNAVWGRNSDERLLRLGCKPQPSNNSFQVGGPVIHQGMLEDFERNEIPEIESGQVSRRRGWKKFLRETPTLRAGLDHHAKWGPDVEKQVEEILELWRVVSEAATHAWKNGITYQVQFRLDNTVHFDIGPLSVQQVSAIQCLGEYRRFVYVAVAKDGTIPASFLGRAQDPCACTYCLAAGPDRKNLYTMDTRDTSELEW